MEATFITDAQKEREEWLAGFGLEESAVDDDEKGEYVLIEGARVYIPIHLQSQNIYN